MFSSYKGQLRTFEFKNTTGETIPPFACMIITGSTEEENELVFTVRKTTSSDASAQQYAAVAFNTGQAVPNGNNARCTLTYPALALVSGAVSVGDEVGPVSGSWYMGSSGSAFIVTSTDATQAYNNGSIDSYLVSPNPKATNLVHFKSGASAISAFNAGTGQMGTGTVDEYESNDTGDLSATGSTVAVWNNGFEFPASSFGHAVPNKEGLLVITSGITGIRIDSNTVQYTVDGTTWVTWDTGTTCS